MEKTREILKISTQKRVEIQDITTEVADIFTAPIPHLVWLLMRMNLV
jgi:thiamine phosphate synthase YjbQ (UPF0047 family)